MLSRKRLYRSFQKCSNSPGKVCYLSWGGWWGGFIFIRERVSKRSIFLPQKTIITVFSTKFSPIRWHMIKDRWNFSFFILPVTWCIDFKKPIEYGLYYKNIIGIVRNILCNISYNKYKFWINIPIYGEAHTLPQIINYISIYISHLLLLQGWQHPLKRRSFIHESFEGIIPETKNISWILFLLLLLKRFQYH